MATNESIQIPVRTCSVHELEELTVYCKDCSLPICIVCCREDHLNHDVEGIAKYARDLRSKIPQTCEEVRGEKLPLMKGKIESLRNAVEENERAFEAECTNLDKLKESLIDTVASFIDNEKDARKDKFEKCNNGMIDQQRNLESQIQEVEDRCCKLEKARLDHSNHELIEMETQLQCHADKHLLMASSTTVYYPKFSTIDIEKSTTEFKDDLQRNVFGVPPALPPKPTVKGNTKIETGSKIIEEEQLTIIKLGEKDRFGNGEYKINKDRRIPVAILQMERGKKEEDVNILIQKANAFLSVLFHNVKWKRYVPNGLLKSMSKLLTDEPQAEALLAAEFLSQTNHPNVLRLIGTYSHSEDLYTVFENLWIDRGSLRTFLKENRSFPLPSVVLLMWQVTQGMVYLHTLGIIHKQLMLPYIWFSNNGEAIITFGDAFFSEKLKEGELYTEAAEAGKWPLKWLPPESIYYWSFGRPTDVWSFGITLWEAMTHGERPYGKMNGLEVLRFLVEKNQRLPKPPGCPDEIYDIMMECWNYEKDERPTFTDLEKRMEKQYLSSKGE